VTDAITIHNPRNRGGSTGHVLAKRSVTFTEIRTQQMLDENKAYFKKILNDFLNRYPFNPDLFPLHPEAATAGTP
jgi:hypothetical protein